MLNLGTSKRHHRPKRNGREESTISAVLEIKQEIRVEKLEFGAANNSGGERMRIDRFAKFLLVLIGVSLGAIALRPYVAPPAVEAQSGEVHPFYVEPGTYMLREPDGRQQVLGKVMIDMRNGNVWGFPTLTREPYPATGAQTTPQTAHPFLLGKFALTEMEK